jgi:hypothetical protein
MAEFKSKLVDDTQAAVALTDLLSDQRGEIEPIERDQSINEERGIFRARDEALRHIIAVKVLSADDAEKDSKRNRLLQEAQVLGHLEHPNIVPIHDVAKDADGNLYYSMTLVKGRSLAQILAEPQKRTEAVVTGGAHAPQKKRTARKTNTRSARTPTRTPSHSHTSLIYF